jgi:hypothetical protein
MEDGTPPMVKVGNDVILLTEEYIKAKTQAQIEALQYGNVQAGNQSDLQNKIREARASETAQNGAGGQDKLKDDKTPAQDKGQAEKALESEMRDFRRYVMNRLKKKSRGKRKFETEVISDSMRDGIYARLEKAESIEDIDDIFDSALYDAKVEMAKEHAESEIQAVFDDIQQEIIDNLDDLDEEELETEGSAKKYLLLLILLGDLDYRGKVDTVLRDTLKYYADIAIGQANDEIRRLGGKVSKGERKKIADDYIAERMDFLNKEINRVTEERLGNMFAEVKSVDDIKNGLADNYALSESRAKIIANTEYHYLQNEVVLQMADKADEVVGMFVTDGVRWDEECQTANNSVWSLSYAKDHVISHPNCIRQMHPINKDFLDNYGGFDQE